MQSVMVWVQLLLLVYHATVALAAFSVADTGGAESSETADLISQLIDNAGERSSYGDKDIERKMSGPDHQKQAAQQGSCLTSLRCPRSQCCVRPVHTEEDGGRVEFNRVGHCMNISALENESQFELNPIMGALATTEDPVGLLHSMAVDQDLLLVCRSHTLRKIGRDDVRKRRMLEKDDVIDSDTILPVLLAPDVAFARRVEEHPEFGTLPPSPVIDVDETTSKSDEPEGTEFPSVEIENPEIIESPEVVEEPEIVENPEIVEGPEVAEGPEMKVQLVGIATSRGDRIRNVVKQALAAKDKLKYILSELDNLHVDGMKQNTLRSKE